MTSNRKNNSNKRRALPREVRQEQLIRATIKCIAKTGLSGVTMARVTSEAGMSLGIANLHFKSKNKLLLKTLEYVTAEYNSGQRFIFEDENYPSLAARLEALLAFDFSTSITDKNKLAVWFAFLGEAKSRPTYQRICARQDAVSETEMIALFQAIIDEGGYRTADAALLAAGYISMVDGLWINSLVEPRRQSRKKARLTARHYLATAFPEHITLDGT